MIKIIHTADWHFGHIKTSTSDTISSITKYLFPLIKEADALFVVGDVFDMSVSFNNHDAVIIIDFFLQLFNMLDEHDTILRVLRGTFSHDRNQIKILNSLYAENGFNFDFKYIDKIEFETIKQLKKRVLYLPDNLNFKSSNEIMKYIKKQMGLLGYSTVDIVLCHGDFVHAYPDNVILPKSSFNIKQFDFVNDYILLGHNHTPSIYGKAIYSGSINRLRHGEEEEKGFFYITDAIRFIKNKESTKYITADLKKETNQDDIIIFIDRFINRNFILGNRGYLRLLNCPSEFKQSILHYVAINFPTIKLSFKKNKKQYHENIELLVNSNQTMELPTKKNINRIIYETIIKYKFDVIEFNTLSELMQKI